jgi:hypothetical protein
MRIVDCGLSIWSAAACCRFHTAKLASRACPRRGLLRRTKAQASVRNPSTSPYLWNGVRRAFAFDAKFASLHNLQSGFRNPNSAIRNRPRNYWFIPLPSVITM